MEYWGKNSMGEILRRHIMLLDASCAKSLLISGNLCVSTHASTLLNVYQCGAIGFTNRVLYKATRPLEVSPLDIRYLCSSGSAICPPRFISPTWQPSLHIFAPRPPQVYLPTGLVADSKILHDYHSLGHTAFFIFDRDLLPDFLEVAAFRV